MAENKNKNVDMDKFIDTQSGTVYDSSFEDIQANFEENVETFEDYVDNNTTDELQ